MPPPTFSAPPTVLVVDDQRITRRLAQRILSEAGYRVYEAEDGVEALNVIGRTGNMDLVLVDVVMPRLDGAGLVRQLAVDWPEQRVLYMSAYPAQVLDQYQPPDLQVPFLAKPFSREELLAKVGEALRLPAQSAKQPSSSPRVASSEAGPAVSAPQPTLPAAALPPRPDPPR